MWVLAFLIFFLSWILGVIPTDVAILGFKCIGWYFVILFGGAFLIGMYQRIFK